MSNERDSTSTGENKNPSPSEIKRTENKKNPRTEDDTITSSGKDDDLKDGEGSAENENQEKTNEGEYLEVDHLDSDFQERSVQGGIYMVLAQAARFVLKMGSTVFLARLLTPEDFGLVAMASAITGFMMIFKDLGLSMATIQREDITHAQVTGLFWVNVGVSASLAVAAAASAPGIAWFYGDARLVEITMALSVGFLFGGLTTQHEAILKRQMRFQVLAGLEVASILIGSAVAIVYALMGGGYWSLVLLNLMRPFVFFGGVWVFCRWRPSLPWKGKEIMELLTFGGNLTGFNVINYFARRGDDILVGRFVGASALGLYQKAYQLLLLPLRQLNTPLTAVMIPTLSRTVTQPSEHRRIFVRTVEAILMVTMPTVAFLMVTSDWIILIVLGSKWVEAAELYRLLGIVGLVQPVSNATGWLFVSQDRTREKLYWGGVGGGLILLSFFAGLPWGAKGVAASYSISGLFLRTPLLFWYVGRRGPVRTRDLYKTLIHPGGASMTVFATLIVIRWAKPVLSPHIGLSITLLAAGGLLILLYAFSNRARRNARIAHQHIQSII